MTALVARLVLGASLMLGGVVLPAQQPGGPGMSLGRDYAGPWQGKWADGGIEPPVVFWSPSIATSSASSSTPTATRCGARCC